MSSTRAVLVVLGGLPGTGKTTVANEFVRASGAAYLRIDTIEQTVVEHTALEQPLGPVGYEIGYALAAEQLGAGTPVVVAECVNPLQITRDAWRDAASAAGAALVEVEIVCSDAVEHRRRVEQRTVDVPGLRLPTWADVQRREYEPWDQEHLVLDTAHLDAAGCARAVEERVAHAAG
ncbi:AAA family ATPase [Pseudonocardia phyllosphaerae]|uniref:AAA family ATPase n=1 Tax=Pseudonocardia phyllosphaerae TaxID=3390502 RepID=UPI00397E2824